MRKFNHSFLCLTLLLLFLTVASCIKNDLPFPKIQQNISDIAVEGESKSASIDSVDQVVQLYLDEQTDIEKVKFTKFAISGGGKSDINLLEGEYNLSSPLFVTLSLYQDYVWEIRANQTIERYFEVEDEVGQSVVDPVAKRVVVNMMEGTDLANLNLIRVKLGPADITTYTPELKPGKLNLEYPLRVAVTAWGRTEIWTIYAELTEQGVVTSGADAWSKVIWVYGSGKAGDKNGFQYRKAGDENWIDVPDNLVNSNQGTFSCCISHLEPLTEYEVRAVSDKSEGEIISVTTQATADIPNGDFEQWSQTENGMWLPWNTNGERFWDTGNTGSYTVRTNLTTPTDYTPTGSGRAARMESINILIKLAAGSIYTGEYLRTDVTDGVLGFGRPWKLRPTKLKGYMQYQAATISNAGNGYGDLKGRPDSCQIYVALTDWTEPFEIRTRPSNRQLFDPNSSSVIAYGELTFSGKQDNYVPFEIELNYRSTARIPSYLQITCTASKYGDYFTGGNGSLLYVDQLSFDWDY